MGDRSALTVTIHAVDPTDQKAVAAIHQLFDEHGLGEFGGPVVKNTDPTSLYTYVTPEAPNGEKIALGYAYGASECNLDSAEEAANVLAEHPSIVAECQQDPRYEIAGYAVMVANGRGVEVGAESEGDQYVSVTSVNELITNGVLDYPAYRRLIGADFRDAIDQAKAERGDTLTWIPLPTGEDD